MPNEIAKIRRCMLQTEWAHFPGFSLLMDNEVGYRPVPGQPELAEIAQGREDAPAMRLYGALASAMTAIGQELAACGLCELPPPSYHVTLLDGISISSVGDLAEEHRHAAQRCLDRLPGSVGSELPCLVDCSPVTFSGPLSMRFAGLQIRHGSALVARLEPTEDSKPVFDEILAARRALDESWTRATGRPTAGGYMPHVSLGYFIDPELTAQLGSRLERWNEIAATHAADSLLRFESASVYGFSDMVRFYKDPGDPAPSSADMRPTLVEAFDTVGPMGLSGIPDAGRWLLTSGELTTIEECVRRTPRFELEAHSIHIAWNAIPTVAFEGFPLEVLALKDALGRLLGRLDRENQGSRWAKITLGALNDGRELDREEAAALDAAVRSLDLLIAAAPWHLLVDELSVVAFVNRSLDRRWATHRIGLADGPGDDHLPLPSATDYRRHREAVAEWLTRTGVDQIVSTQSHTEHRVSRYRRPRSELTLVFDVKAENQAGWIAEFKERVDRALPDRYTWFDPDSLHVTVRALLPV